MKGLNGWMRLLEGSETAVLSTLIEELERITDSDESSGSQLANVILKDASLTSNVIRIANSAHFNPGEIAVTTVSRAILNIGFKNIRGLCLSLKMLDAVLEESSTSILVEFLAKVLHSAAQAKSLVSDLTSSKQEEVFVAAMLSHLTELLVLSSSENDAKELRAELSAESSKAEINKIAERTLGVSMSRLARTLMKQWRIEGMVNDVLSERFESGSPVEAVIIADEISRASLLGWDSVEFHDILKRVADFKDVSEFEAKRLIQATADETAKTIDCFGKNALKDLVPTSKTQGRLASIRAEKAAKPAQLKPNRSLLKTTLQDLEEAIASGNFNVNSIFKDMLQVLHKGVGLERVCVAIFDKTNMAIRAKYVLGEQTKNWKDKFSLRYVKSHNGFLYKLFEADQNVWIGNPDHRHLSQYVTGEYKGITGADYFFIAPLTAKGRRIGVVYADMQVSNRDLTQDYFTGFCQLVQQANDALDVLAKK